MENGQPKPFHERLEEGKAFEDFASDVLWANGIVLGPYHSRRKQWTKGENRIGAEVKYDKRIPETKRLFIETRERRDTTDNSHWRRAGIYDQCKPWLYVIGNYHAVWIFAVTTLTLLHSSQRYEEKKTATAEGFVMPVEDADKYAALKIYGDDLTGFR